MNTLHREITASGPVERSGEQNCEVDGSLCGSGIVPRVLLFDGLEASIFSLSVRSFPRIRTTQVVISFLSMADICLPSPLQIPMVTQVRLSSSLRNWLG